MLRELRSFLDGLPDHLDEVHEARQRVAITSGLLEDNGEGSHSAQVAEEFGDWLVGYFQSVFFRPLLFGKLTHEAQRSYHQFRGPPSMGDLAYGINPVSLRGQFPPGPLGALPIHTRLGHR